MQIVVHLDVLMAARKMSLAELAAKVGISTTNLSLLKNGHVRGIRFNTLAAICHHLECQPGEVLEFRD